MFVRQGNPINIKYQKCTEKKNGQQTQNGQLLHIVKNTGSLYCPYSHYMKTSDNVFLTKKQSQNKQQKQPHIHPWLIIQTYYTLNTFHYILACLLNDASHFEALSIASISWSALLIMLNRFSCMGKRKLSSIILFMQASQES